MLQKILLSFFWIFIPGIFYAQFYKTYNWEAEPVPVTENDSFAVDAGAYYIIDRNVMEFDYNSYTGDLECYETVHKRIKIYAAEALENFNKVYVSLYGVNEIIDMKARSILPGGGVRVLRKSEIKEVRNLENQGDFKLFAIEGLEINGEVEYIYTVKKTVSGYWARYIQDYYPKKQYGFTLICPENLEFAAYIVNDTLKAVDSTSKITKKRYIQVDYSFVKAFKEELFSATNANLLRAEFKLLYYHSGTAGKFFTFTKGAEYLYEVFYSKQKPDKTIAKMVKTLDLKTLSTLEKVKKIETFIKTHFVLGAIQQEEPVPFKFMLDHKAANEIGFARLFVEFLRIAGVDAIVGTTSNRMDRKFNRAFESWSYFEEYILYIPEADVYIEPASMYARAGFINAGFTNTEALFMKKITLGDFTSAVADIKFIPALPAEANQDNIYISLALENDFYGTSGHIERSSTGLIAGNLQPYYGILSSKAQQQLIIPAIESCVGKDAILSDLKVSNYQEPDWFIKPFTISCNYTSNNLVENAGDKYLVRIGELIGPQSEIYKDETRNTDIENEYNRKFSREIVFTIPDGYKVTNPEVAVIRQEMMFKGKVAASFASSYTLENNTMTIKIEEYYSEITIPKTDYEPWRKVINAAADFNKVKLLISPL